MTTEFFECHCASDEHTIRFVLDEKYGELYVSVFLGHAGAGFWRRCLTALKYALGYKCRYGHFDTTIVRPEDYDRLISLFQKSKKLGEELADPR